MILCIDNYDSFVHNLARYFVELGQEVRVLRNDSVELDCALGRRPAAVVISPGPCAPRDAGRSLELIRRAPPATPILGICLGHQAIAAAWGGRIVRSARPLHGQASWIRHDGRGEFTGLANPFAAGRYHSLIVEEATLPDAFSVSARDDDGQIMALRHRELPVYGWQFHPESILTPCGYLLIANFLSLVGIPSSPPPTCEPLPSASSGDGGYSRHGQPLTF